MASSSWGRRAATGASLANARRCNAGLSTRSSSGNRLRAPAAARSRGTSGGDVAADAADEAPLKQQQHQPRDLYQLLGVAAGATQRELRAAYRRAAAASHPDQNAHPDVAPRAARRFAAVRLAYDALRDANTRSAYDRYGLAALGPAFEPLIRELSHDGGGSEGAARTSSSSSSVGDGGGLPERGADVSTVMGLDFAQSVTGAEVVIATAALGACRACGGDGGDAGVASAACRVCRGDRRVLIRPWRGAAAVGGGGGVNDVPLLFPRFSPCPACGGRGAAPRAPCPSCGGEGRARRARRVTVRVPAGVRDGQVLRVAGQGDAGRRGGAPGDLFVQLQVYQNLPDVERVGDDLHSVVTVNVFDALLGTTLSVRTVRGRDAALVVPPGTAHGDTLRLERAGVARPARGGGVVYGNHVFNVRVSVPRVLDCEEEADEEAAAVAARRRGEALELLMTLRRLQQQQRQRRQ